MGMKLIARSLLIAGATVCLCRTAGAAPRLEMATMVPMDLDSPGQMLRFFPDHDDPKVYWWAPYELVIARHPTTRRPLVKWNTQPGTARISFVANLSRLGFATENDILNRFAASVGKPLNQLDMRPLAFRDLRLKFNYEMLGGFAPGDWHPESSIEAQNISESISLTEEENELLVKAYKVGTAGLRVAMGMQGHFSAHLEPSRWSREYKRPCVVDAMLDGETIADLAGRELSRRVFLGRIYRAESGCVTKASQLGKPPEDTEILDGWLGHLRKENLLIDSTNPKSLKIGEKQAWETFLRKTLGQLEVEIPSGIHYYPAEFGSFLLELRPTE